MFCVPLLLYEARDWSCGVACCRGAVTSELGEYRDRVSIDSSSVSLPSKRRSNCRRGEEEYRCSLHNKLMFVYYFSFIEK
ncbi:hypothetical protein P8452_72580 [Trifolium repens]|nr:hypothetical protein P8452_72580 [Trifolium repens]